MGCCHSTPAGGDDPEQAQVAARSPRQNNASESRANINAPAQSNSNVNSPRESSNSDQARPSPHRPSGGARASRPNQPVRAPSPLPSSPAHNVRQPPPWTRSHLAREREAFFDTRVTGQLEVWNALRIVCEMLQHGDVEQAQGMLDAVNLTCPNGRVAFGRGRDRSKGKGGIYDERGELYDLPAWVVTDPEDIIEDPEKEEEGGIGSAATTGLDGATDKGKGREADLGKMISLRVRLSDCGKDIVVRAGKQEKVASIVRKIQQQIGPKRVRLIYKGRTLQEGKTLEESAYKDDDVVNAYVFEGDESKISGRSG